MCGRFALDALPKEIKKQFHVSVLPPLEPNYNACPTEPILILVPSEEGVLRGELFRWGLIPFFSKEIPRSQPLINARSETVDKLASFKKPFKSKRGLVVMNGFFEWMTEEGVKQPYFICRKDTKLLAIASLWDLWESGSGKIIYSCCMITTPPNEFLAPFHDRMPAILDEQAQNIWLNSVGEDVNELKSVLKPYNEDNLMMYPVTREVGSPYFKNKMSTVPKILSTHLNR
jgi:putative SOS response-associated peptidase YedK